MRTREREILATESDPDLSEGEASEAAASEAAASEAAAATSEQEINTDESHLRDVSEITGFDKLTSFTAFMLGMFMNWGSFNVMGFMMGMNYRFFLDKNNVSQIYLDLQTIFPAFVLGVFLVNIYIPYFIASIVLGYTYRSRGLHVPKSITNMGKYIPEEYRNNIRYGNRNQFMRNIFGFMNSANNNFKEKEV